MKSSLIVFLVALAGLSTLLSGEVVKGFDTEFLILYQPDPVLRERLPSGPEELASYVKLLQGECTKFFATADKPETLQIVVALRPGKQSRVWFISSTRLPGAKELEPLRRKLEAVPPGEVYQGPVVFAISAKIAGGDGKLHKPDGDYPFPIPKEWQDAAKGHNEKLLDLDGFLSLVWPEVISASTHPAASAPIEFETQVLEPTGGKILRPKEWFFKEGHHGSTYMWTLSREDTSKGQPYITGFRIQTFIGVKDGTGKSAKEFILDFIAAKKKEAVKVVKTCAEHDQGFFTRICLETEEGPYHIQYSMFWGTNALDIAVITIAGTTKELWPTYSPTFDKMGAFELIDMKRFEH